MLAFLVLLWLFAFVNYQKIAFYGFDVSAAFDRVDKKILMEKIHRACIHQKMQKVLLCWLGSRKANVVVSGTQSCELIMKDMIFQGTVLGPLLWNIFFSDAGQTLRGDGFTDMVVADDLTGMRFYPSHISDDSIVADLRQVQTKLHVWGEDNRVVFDASKESFHILSRSRPYGGNFKLLGITFDPKLSMYVAVHECVGAANWKLQSLLRTRNFYNDGEMVQIFKSHLLSFIEYRTTVIAHVRFNISHEEALFQFNLTHL